MNKKLLVIGVFCILFGLLVYSSGCTEVFDTSVFTTQTNWTQIKKDG